LTVSDQLHDLIIIRQLLLQRIIGGQDAAINKQLDAVAASIEKALKGDDLTTYKGKRLVKAIDELKAMVSITPPDLAELATAEASFLQSAFVSVGIDTVIPPASVVNTIAKTSLIQGATIGEWFGRLNESAKFDIERAIKNGITLGQTNREIAKAIVGNGSDKGPQALAKARRDAMAITRTGVQTIANEARMAGLMENQDIIKAVQWVSTLDSRTSEICIARSGKTWTFPEFKPIGHSIPWNGGPPAHWSCRSSYVPITKSFAEIRGEPVAKEISQTTRASMDGQVAADLSFDQFLKSKPAAFADEMLGKGKAQLWRSGKITLSQLLDQRGNPLTLTQLSRL
jgi:SPP1 gp7 family putative phage head morphogenesis protein